jgi:phosphatidylglycerophosphate synthase
VVADALTLLRLVLAPVLAVAIAHEAPVAASAVFFAAVATDMADGRLARRAGRVSPWGGLFDHAVDAIFCTVGTAALARAGALPAALPPLIAVAFLQYALDSRLLAARGLRPSALGRANGIAYYAIVAVPVVRDALGLAGPGATAVQALGWGLVATTVASILDRGRRLLRRPSAPAVLPE